MYAADVMSMSELKEKLSYINREIEDIKARSDQEDLCRASEKISAQQVGIYTEQIERFINLENLTNGDIRKIISRITVNREGEIRIYLRDLSDLTAL